MAKGATSLAKYASKELLEHGLGYESLGSNYGSLERIQTENSTHNNNNRKTSPNNYLASVSSI